MKWRKKWNYLDLSIYVRYECEHQCTLTQISDVLSCISLEQEYLKASMKSWFQANSILQSFEPKNIKEILASMSFRSVQNFRFFHLHIIERFLSSIFHLIRTTLLSFYESLLMNMT